MQCSGCYLQVITGGPSLSVVTQWTFPGLAGGDSRVGAENSEKLQLKRQNSKPKTQGPKPRPRLRPEGGRMWLRRKSRELEQPEVASWGPPKNTQKNVIFERQNKKNDRRKKKKEEITESHWKCQRHAMRLSVCLRPLRATKIITIIVHNTKSKCQLPKAESRTPSLLHFYHN